MPKPDESTSRPGIRLRRLRVQNFKALDDLELEFPPPEMPGDPDVLVLGSRNGLGKTSVLEACSLLVAGAELGPTPDLNWPLVFDHPPAALDFVDLLVRAGQDEARVRGDFELEDAERSVRVSLYRPTRHVMVETTGTRGDQTQLERALCRQWPHARSAAALETAGQLLLALAGASPEPFVCAPLLYLHSYRRVREGNTRLEDMVERGGREMTGAFGQPGVTTAASFKGAVIRAMMAQKGLFEGVEPGEAGETVDRLSKLMQEYADGTIGKLRTSRNGTIEIRVSREGSEESFPLDGLSSGQKEIISTFFLIWQHTHASPGIVLIDEPELHLNAEWQIGFVRQLHRLVRGNQLIIATHSEDVAGSVERSRRVLLEAGKGAGHGRG